MDQGLFSELDHTPKIAHGQKKPKTGRLRSYSRFKPG